MAKLGEIRRAQLITTYGPGALIPIDEHSYIVVGLDSWDVSGADGEIREPRLERRLGVGCFVLPPSSDSDAGAARDIPVLRFPRTYSCSGCHTLGRYSDIKGIDGLCATCSSRLVTSRFVVVCEAGHLNDFPYHRWVHRGNPQPEGPDHRLTLEARGRSAALDDIRISCSCGALNSMGGALGKQALKALGTCSGHRPWLRGAPLEACDLTPRGLQRGASNVWQSITESSISIPPWSNDASRFVDRYAAAIDNLPDNVMEMVIEGMIADARTRTTIGEVMAVVVERKRLQAGEPPTMLELRQQEHEALMRGRIDDGQKQDFICVVPDKEPVPRPVAHLRLVTRLREVRALTGFHRLSPSGTADLPAARLSREPVGWLPAIEVSGEGVFIGLDLDVVRQWETDQRVVDRISRLGGAKDSSGNDLPADRTPNPRRVLVHTLAHILIDQWSLDCGYPSSALRERLYVGGEMAGVLIYTATSDSAGSLGGVVGMAMNGRFELSLRQAIAHAAWCSNDPLCMESGAVGVEARNLGACHACALLPETSCELGNTLLDRGVLVGADGCPGFFETVLNG